MSRDTTTPERKLELLEELGLKKGPNYGKARGKASGANKGFLGEIRSYWDDYDGISESSVRKYKALAAQRNRARRK